MSKIIETDASNKSRDINSKNNIDPIKLKTYKKPTLTRYGSISELVLNQVNIGADGGPFGNNFS